MSSWSLRALKQHINSRNEESEFDMECIDSIARSIDIYTYHLNQATTLTNLVKAQTPQEQMDLIFPAKENRKDVWERNLAIQANIQACIHSARAINDLFAQLVNSLLLNRSISIARCGIHRVTKELPFSDLKEHLQALLNSREFKYVNAFVNTIKHRKTVMFGSMLCFESNDCGVRFKSFKFNDSEFEKMWAEEILQLTLVVKNNVVVAGSILNRQLGLAD